MPWTGHAWSQSSGTFNRQRCTRSNSRCGSCSTSDGRLWRRRESAWLERLGESIDVAALLPHDNPPLPPRNAPSPADSVEIAQLRDEVTDLKNQVRLLTDILDEIRVDLQWVTQNGLPIREPLPACPTLKRMALDLRAEDWGERLVIEYRSSTRNAEMTNVPIQAAAPTPPSIGMPPTGKLFSDPGEQRRLF